MRKKLHDNKNRKTPVRWQLRKGKNVWVCLAFYEVAQGGPRGGDTHPPEPKVGQSSYTLKGTTRPPGGVVCKI